MRLCFFIPAIVAVTLSAQARQAEPPPPARQQQRRSPGPARPRATVLDRLEQMTPEQRRRALEKLPPERRRRVQERLDRYESLPPEQRARLRDQYERFRALPPEKQDAARKLFREFGQLPPDRRRVLRREALQISRMDEAGRQAGMNSPGFRSRYTPTEQRMIRGLVELTPQPSSPVGND